MKIAISHLEYEGKSQQEQSLIRKQKLFQLEYFQYSKET